MSANYQQPGAPNVMLDPSMVTTGLELPGYRIVRSLGVVRGIIVRSRNVFASFGAGLQTILGGNITIYSNLCEKTRQDAFIMMMDHAAQHGANAVIAARYDANELMQGVTEVLAYGTAVYVERL
ncbi:MAG TPA: YbjQ family protein [Acidobacteriaceae bacterium]|nr:YbjQ family protein [Acidobacteriaceae bacterium]